MLLLLLASITQAGPRDGPERIRAEHEVRLAGEDRLLGLGLPAEAPEEPPVVLRPLARLSEGDLIPVDRWGDTEPGEASLRLGAEAWAEHGILEAHALLWAGGDLAPGGAHLRAQALRLGIRTPGFWLALAQEPRWVGPGRHGSLVLGDSGGSLPGVDLGGTWRFPGAGDVLGRFGASTSWGWIPERRHGPDYPGWLLMDLRWKPLPQVELGASRRAIFGGWEDGSLRPVDPLQLLLPSEPHVEDDPDRLLHDSDEAAAIDARLLLPVGRWLRQPVDYVELWVQHGGEDLIDSELGSLPWAQLAGVANLYGGEVVAGSLYLGSELAIIEDDSFRWYTGHRLYHDGWTLDGRSLGHPRGGDSRSWAIWLGWQEASWWLEGSLERVHRVLVADLVQDTVFVFPEAELRHEAHLRGSLALPDWGVFALDLGLAPVQGAAFLPGESGVEHRLEIRWTGPGRSPR